ncbi:MAG: Diacylglycerol kinase [Bacteroidota bacterium]|jgi:YegS/Rv2252/BmrU family lipid kinase
MVYFIYNPNAGNKSNRYRQKLINTIQKIPNSQLLLTEYPNHAAELIKSILPANPNRIVAIGGDGTINEIGNALKGSNIPMGIIPLGSGNGLARHLNIPMKTQKALAIALHGHADYIDVIGWNKRAFFCTAGIGFDAYVAALFHAGNGRGLRNYIKASLQAFRSFDTIKIKVGMDATQNYFSLTIANANQFGNNAYISPISNLQDALFEIVKIKNGNLWQKAQLGISLFSKRIHQHPLVEVNQAKSIQVQCPLGIYYHLDGESLQTQTQVIDIELLPEKLLVIHP